MAKVKSRDEKLQEEWLEYFANTKLKKEYTKLFEKYVKEIIEPEIKDVNPLKELSEEDLSDIFGCWDSPHIQSKRIIDIYNGKEIEQIKKIEKKYRRYSNVIYQIEEKLDNLKNLFEKSQYFTKLSIENFKGFSQKKDKELNSIKIKPITLIYGPNSYGKSSILQSLLLLNQTAKYGEDYKNIDLLPNGNVVNLGTFSDFLNKKSETGKIKIELTLPYKKYKSQDERIDSLTFCYSFSHNKNDEIILSNVDIYEEEINLQTKNKSKKQVIFNYEIDSSTETVYHPLQHKDFCTRKKSFFKIGVDITLSQYNDSIFDDVENIIKNLIYVSSYRTPPERYFSPEKNRRTYVGKNGQYTSEILDYDVNVRKNVNIWLEKIAGYVIATKGKNSKVSSINLNDNKAEIKDINLIDLGSGVGQVLPIITQAFKSENDIILVEEPEIHLHPRAQAELGEMFVDSVKKRNNTFIIETHSENLLLRLEKLIRKGELSKDDVSVIYVDKNEKNGSYCIPLRIDDEGDIENITDIPDGFFEEGFNELFGVEKR